MFKELKKYPVVILFFVFLFSFSIMDSLWPKRQFSELENRNLAQYPAIKLKDIASNKWMQNYEKYVKDQIIFRDEWIDLKSRCESSLLKTENNGVWYGNDGVMFQKLLSVNDKQITKNTNAILEFSKRHEGKVTAMIAPSASLIWAYKLPIKAPIADEGSSLDYINSTIQQSAAVIDLREKFTQYKDEMLYYSTDHHWTTQGAFLAYEAFAELHELEPFKPEDNKATLQKDFLGTNYSKARRYSTLAEEILWYDLPNILTVYKGDGLSQGTEGGLYNTEKWETRDKYGAFLRGNNGYSIIDGDGEGSILIIKDSYANCFIPFLTSNYEKIGVIDMRATKLSIDELIANENYEKILILYNFQTFSEDIYISNINR